MMQQAYPSGFYLGLGYFGLAQRFAACCEVPARAPVAAGMVRFKEALTPVSGLAGMAPNEKMCGMPLEVVFEKHSDEVTLPNFRPRNSP